MSALSKIFGGDAAPSSSLSEEEDEDIKQYSENPAHDQIPNSLKKNYETESNYSGNGYQPPSLIDISSTQNNISEKTSSSFPSSTKSQKFPPSTFNPLIQERKEEMNEFDQNRRTFSDSEVFEVTDIYGEIEDIEHGKTHSPFIERKPSRRKLSPEQLRIRGTSMDVTSGTAQKGKEVVKKGLVTINDLNDKFMSSNLYYVIIAIALYVGIGIAAYHDMMDWDRFECIYFITITITTVGYGDFVPDTTGKRVFTAFYILLGVTIFGSLFGTITTFVQDHQERMAKLRSMRAMIKMKERDDQLTAQPQTSVASAMNSSAGISLNSLHESSSATDLVEANNSNINKTEGTTGGKKSQFGSISRRLSLLSFSSSEKKREKTLYEYREASIAAYKEDREQLKRAAVMDFFLIFLLLIIGMCCMSAFEGWCSGDAFYWATVTIMTVGYGDFVPHTIEGKIFTILYTLFGCAYMAKAVTDFVKFPLLSRLLKHEIKVVNQFTGDLSPEMLEALFNSELYQLIPDLNRNEDEMSKCEFVLLILQVMNKIEEKDVFLAAKLFDNFDKLKKGFLSKQEMDQKMDEARVREQERERRESMSSAGEGSRTNQLFQNLADRLPSMRNLFEGGRGTPPPPSPAAEDPKKQHYREKAKSMLQKSVLKKTRSSSLPVGESQDPFTTSTLHESLLDSEIIPEPTTNKK